MNALASAPNNHSLSCQQIEIQDTGELPWAYIIHRGDFRGVYRTQGSFQGCIQDTWELPWAYIIDRGDSMGVYNRQGRFHGRI